MSNLKNVQVKVNTTGANVKSGPSLNVQQTVTVASAVSLADAEAQAKTIVGAGNVVSAKATLPLALGSGEGDKH